MYGRRFFFLTGQVGRISGWEGILTGGLYPFGHPDPTPIGHRAQLDVSDWPETKNSCTAGGLSLKIVPKSFFLSTKTFSLFFGPSKNFFSSKFLSKKYSECISHKSNCFLSFCATCLLPDNWSNFNLGLSGTRARPSFGFWQTCEYLPLERQKKL